VDNIFCGYVYKILKRLCTAWFVDMLILWVILGISVYKVDSHGKFEGKKREEGGWIRCEVSRVKSEE
jgi:hypothetical protein